MTEIAYVYAEDAAGWIGKNGQLPWHLPADMKHFVAVTSGHPVIMGRKTFESIGRPLPHRENYVLTHQPLDMAGVHVLASLDELKALINQLQNEDRICIIGGAGVFQACLPLVTDLYRTEVAGDHHGDVKMPPIDLKNWHLVEKKQALEKEPVEDYHFEHWQLNV